MRARPGKVVRLVADLGTLGPERLLDTFGFAHLVFLLTRRARNFAGMHEPSMNSLAAALAVGPADGVKHASLLATSRACRSAL